MKSNLKVILLVSSALLWVEGACPVYASQKTDLSTLTVRNIPSYAGIRGDESGFIKFLNELEKEGAIDEAAKKRVGTAYKKRIQENME